MYKNTTKDPVVAAVTAAIGAGVVACVCVSQGQNVFVGLGVTAFATVVALLVDKYLFD
ncbi:hypothetical protein Pse7367_1368 [Thalassoporum mexicanum PCC 7367]|uniref:hypothetical protein n=1 Tax=Thalassoporum mexicanum TaxID=3457544 RepID=UPI00029FCA2B|nr:hypothetical protein [Pseudanabaena sp. PCC 7367]AFY69660.1 hypothetical protein Pse7367_1368 [Pseudanabaena sp. PCC 7367]